MRSGWLTELTPVTITVELSQHVYQYFTINTDFNISGWPQVRREERNAGSRLPDMQRVEGQMSLSLSFEGTDYASWPDTQRLASPQHLTRPPEFASMNKLK